MRKLTFALLSLALLALPGAASAGGLHLELTLGSGLQVSTSDRIPTTAGLAVGYGLTDTLKLQVGGFAALGDVKSTLDNSSAGTFDMDVRGMVVVAPPLFPLYLRGIAGVANVLDGPKKVTYGGALGVGFGLFGVGAFVEAGAMQRTYRVVAPVGSVSATKDGWQAEARVGLSIG